MLAYEARQLARTARASASSSGPTRWVNGVDRQSIFHLSQFTLLLHDFERRGNRLGFAYFHGRPGTPGMPEFDACFETLRRRHAEIDRVQVTNARDGGARSRDRDRAREGAPDPDRDRRRGVPVRGRRRPRAAARRALELPESAFVVGSFQKDGVGWGDGLEPKLIKGPDVLLAVAERLRERVPELVVPPHRPGARVREPGSSGSAIPYRHVLLPDVEAVAQAYEAIDVCLVTSRDEGGPRAVLEAMATGVPLVTTRVGQAADLVRHGENGWMVDVEDVDGLVEWAAHVAAAPDGRARRVLASGRGDGRGELLRGAPPALARLLDGFVAMPDGE